MQAAYSEVLPPPLMVFFLLYIKRLLREYLGRDPVMLRSPCGPLTALCQGYQSRWSPEYFFPTFLLLASLEDHLFTPFLVNIVVPSNTEYCRLMV